jgi:hypothetical protein
MGEDAAMSSIVNPGGEGRDDEASISTTAGWQIPHAP